MQAACARAVAAAAAAAEEVQLHQHANQLMRQELARRAEALGVRLSPYLRRHDERERED